MFSPKDRRLIWAGTDDGRLQLTRDGGTHWKDVIGNVPGLPAGTDEVVAKALAPDPEKRYHTPGEFGAALQGLQG